MGKAKKKISTFFNSSIDYNLLTIILLLLSLGLIMVLSASSPTDLAEGRKWLYIFFKATFVCSAWSNCNDNNIKSGL